MYIVTRDKLVLEDFNPDFITELSIRPVVQLPIGEYLYKDYFNTKQQCITDNLKSAYNITTDITNLYTKDTIKYSSTNYMLTVQQDIGAVEASSIRSDITNYVTLDFLADQLQFIKDIFADVNNSIFQTVVEHHASGEYVITEDITMYSGNWVEEVELEGGFKLWRKL